MCDFADDPEQVRKLLVGRVLTVERVRQLDAKDYFYQMLKDNPEMLKIRPGVENERLEGAIDCHIHAGLIWRSPRKEWPAGGWNDAGTSITK